MSRTETKSTQTMSTETKSTETKETTMSTPEFKLNPRIIFNDPEEFGPFHFLAEGVTKEEIEAERERILKYNESQGWVRYPK